MSKRDKYVIEIVISCQKNDEGGFEFSLDEAVSKIKQGYVFGRDYNEDEEYSFVVNKTCEDGN